MRCDEQFVNNSDSKARSMCMVAPCAIDKVLLEQQCRSLLLHRSTTPSAPDIARGNLHVKRWLAVYVSDDVEFVHCHAVMEGMAQRLQEATERACSKSFAS
jgi:hypothetical protein